MSGSQAGKGWNPVDDFINKMDHPLKDLVMQVRELILKTEPHLTEQVKWNAPSFGYKGDDRITMNLSKKDQLLLIFHLGAKVRDEKNLETLIRDPDKTLEWLSSNRAVMRFRSTADLKTREAALKNNIKVWLQASL
jgi:uncharacterized protein YdeI (YjbR/CyaY-like superfamily)